MAASLFITLKNLRLGLSSIILYAVVTLEKTKIKTLGDLKGKIVSVGARGVSLPLTRDFSEPAQYVD